MLEILSFFLIFIFLFYVNGLIILKNCFSKTFIDNFNVYEISIFGIVCTGIIAYIINFFFPLSNTLVIANLTIGIIFIFNNRKKYFHFNKPKTVATILLILSIINIYGSGFSDDLNHYHGSLITNFDNHKYIFGLNFLQNHFGYSPIWLSLHSYANINEYYLQSITVVNGILFFLILSTLCVAIKDLLENKKITVASFLAIFSFFFILLKYTRLKEFGIDRPAYLLLIFQFFIFTKFYALKEKNYNRSDYVLCLTIIGLFIFFIKNIFFISLLLPGILIFQEIKILFLKKFLIIYLIIIAYLLKNFIISGCLIYPINLTCFDVSWSSIGLVNNLFDKTEMLIKGFPLYGGNLTPEVYIANFNWIPTWWSRTKTEFLEFFFTSFLCFVLTISAFNYQNSYCGKKIFLKNKIYIFVLSVILICNLILFFKIPVIRYFHSIFIYVFFLILCLWNLHVIIRKKTLLTLLILSIFFNILKNFNRIKDSNFENNPIKHIKKIRWYSEASKQKLGKFTYYNGWIGGHPIGNVILNNHFHTKVWKYDIINKIR
tara:strand:+ start:4186 stop:5820 length:1635 start_codon:yes stop_codon:yes gene_type:complete